MKNRIVAIVFIFGLVSLVNAQIPNPGFENWYTSANGYDPVGWMTSNASPFVSVEQATPGYQGNYAVKVKTWQAGPVVAVGSCQSNAFYYSSRPSALTGYVKCTIMPGDTVSIVITVTLGGVAGVGVGQATKFYASGVSSFTAFNLPVYYGSSSATDTIYIDIFAGSYLKTPTIGTEIIVDELSLTPATAIDNTKVTCSGLTGQNYPNPSKEFTIIPLTLTSPDNIYLKIYDTFGREIKTIFNEAMPAGENQLRFSVADFGDGMYYYVVYGNNFKGSGKFAVSK